MLAEISVQAAQHTRDERLNLNGVPEKLRKILDQYLESHGLAQKVESISITSEGFAKEVERRHSNKTKVDEIEHAIPHYINVHIEDVPEQYRSFSEMMEQKVVARTAKEFIDGEQFLYMGKYHSLQINSSEMPAIGFRETFIFNTPNIEVTKNLMIELYQQQAKEELISNIIYFAEHLGVKRKRINITSAKYTWGSCTPAGMLNFNWRIVKAPSEVMDYIVVHELAHLREHNHSVEFWNIVAVQLPQYHDAKQWLKFNGHKLGEDF